MIAAKKTRRLHECIAEKFGWPLRTPTWGIDSRGQART